MRAYQQRRILQLIQTLREAMTELGGLLRQDNAAVAAQLLGDCREGAEGLRAFVDELTGGGTETSALLGETIEQAERALAGGMSGLPEALDGLLERAARSAERELKPDKIEIAFFPYKVSMWDSMESIWRAAQADPRCEAYVVPIPYFDRLPGGKPGPLHYEGSQYPKDVPVVNYLRYNLEDRYPDAIFIHNPYDEGNQVTSVHPSYYAQRLRDMTDMLCYVPYFVTGSYIADHFCQLPGTIYAHKVFVESERVRTLYVRAFTMFAREQGVDAQYARNEKFIALGSPKYDKVVGSAPEDFSLPAAWRRLLRRPDGTEKKAVLYNTSLGAMLSGGAHYIEKLREVIAAFKQRDDLVLWWRPHPLGEATFKSMLPALREGYLSVVNQYKKEAFGIYDDTPDLHRALCLTSAFFGDGSSLMPMYQLTGKPVMIQLAQIRSGASGPWYNVAPSNLCECGGSYWFSARSMNALFRMDPHSYEITYMGSFPGEAMFADVGFYDCMEADGRIYFAPSSAEAIGVYDTNTHTFERIALPEREDRPRPGFLYSALAKFIKVFRYGDRLYFIPSTYPGILEYDLRTGVMTVLDGWVDELGRACNGVDNGFFYNGVFDGDSLILSCACANAALVIDLTARTHRLHRFDGDNNGYVDICLADGACWLLSLYGAVLTRWSRREGTSASFTMHSDADAAKSRALFQRVIPDEGGLLLIPYLSGRMLRFDPAARSVSQAKGIQEIAVDGDPSHVYAPIPYQYLTAQIDGRILMNTGTTNALVAYDPRAEASEEHALRISPDDQAKLRAACLEGVGGDYAKPDDYTMTERPFVGLAEYLDLVADDARAARFENAKAARVRELAHAEGGAGAAIYGEVVRGVLGQ